MRPASPSYARRGGDLGGSQRVAQAVGREQKGRGGVERKGLTSTKSGSSHPAEGADIAEDLVAAGMRHRLGLGQLALVLLFPDRRMVGGQFADPVPEEVEPGIAHVGARSGRRRTTASVRTQAIPPGSVRLGEAEDLVVGEGDGGAGLASVGLPWDQFPASMFTAVSAAISPAACPPSAIHNEVESARIVGIDAVLVVARREPGIRAEPARHAGGSWRAPFPTNRSNQVAAQELQDEYDERDRRDRHVRTWKSSDSTSATPISACSGSACSTPLFRRWPSIQVPLVCR